MDEPLPKTLERYDVLDRIAVGGMAEVFLAKAYGAHGFEKTIAIKRILPELARAPEFAARFIAEAKVAVRLSHANIVQVFDFGRIGESLFIAMEYVDGLDLAALLRAFNDEGRQVPLPAALHIAIELMRALDFAHQHQVVHRDVSPSNILLSRAGEVKIADFGIAVAASPHRAGEAAARRVMGKWRYMSPEQARGERLDTRSDLFSAASVMFELFTGRKLFPGDEAEDIARNIETMPIPKASALRAGIPERLDEILAGPLSRSPADRPARPATVLRSLIELSYESSIMATALDVAEAVASVVPAKRISVVGTQLDDVIRKQLGATADGDSRKTAVTDVRPRNTEPVERGEHSTGLMRKLSADGIAMLEEVDASPGRAPESLGAARERPASSADSGLHRLMSATGERDRRTEVGGPPTGTVPRATIPVDAVENDGGRAAALPSPAPGARRTRDGTSGARGASAARAGGRRRAWTVLALVVAAAGLVTWRLAGSPERSQGTTSSASDAAAETVQWGTVEIDPTPEGARGHIADVAGVVPPGGAFGPTTRTSPARKRVEADKPFRVHVELDGFEPYDIERTVQPGQTLVLTPTLARARATLVVTTTPPGAQVTLSGTALGVTPLTRTDLEPATGELVIARAGFEPLRQRITLAAGKPVEIAQALRAGQRYGQIVVVVKDGWAKAYLKGALLGQVPRDNPLRAPVGRQTLHLVNTGRTPPLEWDVLCEVSESAQTTCTTQLP